MKFSQKLILCLSILFVFLATSTIVLGAETGEMVPTETDKSESEGTQTTFLVDEESGVFHLPDCEEVKVENSFKTDQSIDTLKETYTACEVCFAEKNTKEIATIPEVSASNEEGSTETSSNENSEIEANREYVVNTNPDSLVFHIPDCYHVAQMNDNNKAYRTTSAKYLITEEGIRPCKDCLSSFVAYYDTNHPVPDESDSGESESEEQDDEASNTPETNTIKRVRTSTTTTTRINQPTSNSRTTSNAAATRQGSNPSTGLHSDTYLIIPVFAILLSSAGLLLAYRIRRKN